MKYALFVWVNIVDDRGVQYGSYQRHDHRDFESHGEAVTAYRSKMRGFTASGRQFKIRKVH